mmetsp:Transcript_11093/g.31914  ORF Transcript_11093/g.31914 Transcript_11093/m.31914 type:complete len:102 (+) Transcript_11093:1007-1312(+)
MVAERDAHIKTLEGQIDLYEECKDKLVAKAKEYKASLRHEKQYARDLKEAQRRDELRFTRQLEESRRNEDRCRLLERENRRLKDEIRILEQPLRSGGINSR